VLFIIAEILGLPEFLREAIRPDEFAQQEIPAEAETPTEAAMEVPDK
jgi:hypothetical protein